MLDENKDNAVSKVQRNSRMIPANREELLAQRFSYKPPSLIDAVEKLFWEAYDDENFREYVKAAYNEDAVTGKVNFDQVQAVNRIIELAEQHGDTFVSERKLNDV